MLSQTTRCVNRIIRAEATNRSLTQLNLLSSIRTIATTTTTTNEAMVMPQPYLQQPSSRQLPFPPTITSERCNDYTKDPLIRSIENRTGILHLMDPVPISPTSSTTAVVTTPPSVLEYIESYQMLNRNARKPRKANHGKRPCSRYGRRKRARQYGKPGRGW